jgi:hypothetical protein
LILIITSFSRNDFRSVDDIAPEVLKEPLQVEIDFRQNIRFTKDGYEYNLTPLYEYEISGLVVGKWDYRWFSTYNYDSVFPVDLCLIWGSNMASKVYKNNAVKFSQDCR